MDRVKSGGEADNKVTMVEIPKHIQSLRPYKPGKPIADLAREKNLARIVKLASNENPLGPSPLAVKAMQAAMGDLHRYVHPGSPGLVEALSRKYGIRPGGIVCGHGTDALIAYIIETFTTHEHEVLTSEGTFIGIYVSTHKTNRNLKTVPMRDFAFDLESIRDAISDKTRIIYLANPNNPTGTMIPRTQFEAFMGQVPAHILVILDEAYTTYAQDDPDYPNGLTYEYENMIVTRTLSKAYGLAGVRIGFAVGPERLIKEIYKVKLPFEPNTLAHDAAIAALDDDEFLARTVETNRRNINKMRAAFDRLGLQYCDSVANFLLLILPSEDDAIAFNDACLERGLIVRHVAGFGIPNGIRINTGTDDETEFAIGVIEDVCRTVLKTAVVDTIRSKG